MTKKERKIDCWETMFTIAFVIIGLFTFGAVWFLYGLIKYAVKAGNREAYKDRHFD